MFSTTATYHLKKDGQAKRYSSTSVARLLYYELEIKSDWDTYVQAPTNVSNYQIHCRVGTLQFSTVLPTELLSSAKLGRLTRAALHMKREAKLRDTNQRLLERLKLMEVILERWTAQIHRR